MMRGQGVVVQRAAGDEVHGGGGAAATGPYLGMLHVELRARRDEGVSDAVAAPRYCAHERRAAALRWG